MNLAEAVHTLLVALGPHSLDVEADTARVARMQTHALAIAQVSEAVTCTGAYESDDCEPTFRGTPEQHAAGLLTIGRFESYFSQHIHEDRCRLEIGECDRGRAKSNYQVQVNGIVDADLWGRIGGTDQESTTLAAWAASMVWVRAWRCGTPVAAFRSYATSYCTGKLKDAKKRAEFYERQLQRLQALVRS